MAGLMSRLPQSLLCLGLVLAAGGALPAEDPTRPPAVWQAADSATGNSPDAGGLRLQSVLMPQHGKPVAIIGGTTVALGASVGGATLVRLSEREAVLQGPDGVTRLYLTPDVKKQMIVSPSPRRTGKAGQGKDFP